MSHQSFDRIYRGYRLRLRPQLTHDGQFMAFVMISHGFPPVLLDMAATLDLPSFATAEEAVQAARAAAVRWVNDKVERPAALRFGVDSALPFPNPADETSVRHAQRERYAEHAGPPAELAHP